MFRKFLSVAWEKIKICLASAMMIGLLFGGLITVCRVVWWLGGFAPLIPTEFPAIGYVTIPAAIFVWLLITIPMLFHKDSKGQ